MYRFNNVVVCKKLIHSLIRLKTMNINPSFAAVKEKHDRRLVELQAERQDNITRCAKNANMDNVAFALSAAGWSGVVNYYFPMKYTKRTAILHGILMAGGFLAHGYVTRRNNQLRNDENTIAADITKITQLNGLNDQLESGGKAFNFQWIKDSPLNNPEILTN
jgi:hypothetical protein